MKCVAIVNNHRRNDASTNPECIPINNDEDVNRLLAITRDWV